MIKELHCHPAFNLLGERLLEYIHKIATILSDHVANTAIHVLSTTETDTDSSGSSSDKDTSDYATKDYCNSRYVTLEFLNQQHFLSYNREDDDPEFPKDFVTETELEEALEGLIYDIDLSDYLKKGDVYSNSYIDAQLENLKNLISAKHSISYTAGNITAGTTGVYLIGTLTVDSTAYKLYGKDISGGGSTGTCDCEVVLILDAGTNNVEIATVNGVSLYAPASYVVNPDSDNPGDTTYYKSVLKCLYISVADGTSVDVPRGGYISDWDNYTLNYTGKWSVEKPSYLKGYTRYWAQRLFTQSRTLDSQYNTIEWEGPFKLFDQNDANEMVSNSSASYPAQLFCCSTEGYNGGTPDEPSGKIDNVTYVSYSNYTESIALNGESNAYPEFDWDIKAFSNWSSYKGKYKNSDRWFDSITSATADYLSQLSDEEAEKTLNKTYIYTTYCNYIEEIDGSDELISRSKTKWSPVVQYVNIDTILDTAEKNATIIALNAVNAGTEDLTAAALTLLTFYDWRLQETVPDAGDVDGTVNTLEELYNLTKDSSTAFNYINKLYRVLGEGDDDDESLWTYYMYTTQDLVSQVAALSNDLDTLNTSVVKITPEYIRLQASSGQWANVTWRSISSTVFNSTSKDYKFDLTGEKSDKCTYVSTTSMLLPTQMYDLSSNPFGIIYGYYYRTHYSLSSAVEDKNTYYYYEAQLPLTTTGFINVLSNNVNLGVTNGTTDSKAEIELALTTEGSVTTITSGKIILNGDTIADSITAKYLNIDNTTYLFPKYDNDDAENTTITYDEFEEQTGMDHSDLPDESYIGNSSDSNYVTAIFGAGTKGMSEFDSNGSGYLAGGLINWEYASDGSFKANVKGRIEALAGVIGNSTSPWYIGTDGDEATIYSKTTETVTNEDETSSEVTKSIYISPSLIHSDDETNTASWYLKNDGSASFGHDAIHFDKDGSGHLANCNIRWEKNGDTTIVADVEAKTLTLNGTKYESIQNGHSPYIGDDGYWYAWSDSANGYVNTYVKAEGSSTEGHTPVITLGDDGYWYVDGVKQSYAGNTYIDNNGVFTGSVNANALNVVTNGYQTGTIPTNTVMSLTTWGNAQDYGTNNNAGLATDGTDDDVPVILVRDPNNNRFFVLNPLLLYKGTSGYSGKEDFITDLSNYNVSNCKNVSDALNGDIKTIYTYSMEDGSTKYSLTGNGYKDDISSQLVYKIYKQGCYSKFHIYGGSGYASEASMEIESKNYTLDVYAESYAIIIEKRIYTNNSYSSTYYGFVAVPIMTYTTGVVDSISINIPDDAKIIPFESVTAYNNLIVLDGETPYYVDDSNSIYIPETEYSEKYNNATYYPTLIDNASEISKSDIKSLKNNVSTENFIVGTLNSIPY